MIDLEQNSTRLEKSWRSHKISMMPSWLNCQLKSSFGKSWFKNTLSRWWRQVSSSKQWRVALTKSKRFKNQKETSSHSWRFKTKSPIRTSISPCLSLRKVIFTLSSWKRRWRNLKEKSPPWAITLKTFNMPTRKYFKMLLLRSNSTKLKKEVWKKNFT